MASIFIFLLLVFPPALLIVKFIKNKPAWWLIVLLILIFSILVWFIIAYGYISEQDEISRLIEQGRYEELPEGWDSDGASGLFALGLGWLPPLAYFMICLVIYALSASVRKLFTVIFKQQGQ